jgi:polysaccharide export outer membrane protein
MRRLFSVLFLLAATGCGSAYIPATVGQDSGALDVRVVALTGETVSIANHETSYAPRQLPTAFRQTAGMGSGLRGAGALPEPPGQEEQRPGAIDTRLPPPETPQPYRIGVGDVLVLTTRQSGSTVEELTGLLAAQNRRQGYTVQDDGTIAIPQVGRIEVNGLTLESAESAVFERLVQNQIDPSFSVEVSEFNSKRVALGGAVREPGIVPISLSPLYLNEAIALVGGVTAEDTEFAIVRIYRDGTLYQLPLSEVYAANDQSQVLLRDGDSVFVDTTYQLERARQFFEQQIRLSEFRQRSRQIALEELNSEIAIRRGQLQEQRDNFLSRNELGAVERDHVFLAGEVGQQGRYPLPFGQSASLADALFDAGNGIAPETGNPSQIYVLRASTDPREFGAVTAWHLDASNAVNLTLAARLELRPDDIIFVAEQPITRWNRVIQQAVPSILTASVSAASN